MTCNYAILDVTDGDNTVSLIDGPFYLNRWRQGVLNYKDGGVRVSSPLADGQQMVLKRYADITDEFILSGVAVSPDAAIEAQQGLMNMLDNGADYWVSEWNTTPVYLRARAKGETNTRYAIVKAWSMPELGNPYAAPFLQPGTSSAWEDAPLLIEHGPWLDNAPGDGEYIAIGARGYFNGRWHGNVDEFTGDLTPVGGDPVFSHILFYDDSETAFTNNLLDTELPFALMQPIGGAAIAVDDYVAFGSDSTSILDHPFNGIILDISRGASGLVVTWEYWTGVAWSALTMLADETIVNPFVPTSPLEVLGAVGTRFVPPSDWAAVTLSGVSAYWIRARVTSVTTPVSPIVHVMRPRSQPIQEVFVSNKRVTANLTHIYYYDASGAGFSPNLFAGSGEFSLLSNNGDIFYFGCQTSLTNSGPFSSLVFDIGIGQTGLTVAWEYWNGAAWVTLSVQDNTDRYGTLSGQPFDTNGVGSVHWEQPSDWAAVAVNGVTGYWARSRVTAKAVGSNGPLVLVYPYSITWPYVEIQADEVGGDLPALARVNLTSQSGTNAFYENRFNRVIMGLRAMDRSPLRNENDECMFMPTINLGGEQNGPWIATNPSAFATALWSPTGKVARETNIGASANPIVVILNAPVASEYYGRFRAFLRGYQTSGSEGDLRVAIAVRDTNGSETRNDYITFPVNATAYPSIVDVGTITIPSGVNFGASRPAAESVYLYIYLSGNGAVDADFSDLILIPSDECIVDADAVTKDDGLTSAESAVGDREAPLLNGYLSVDSVSAPRRSIASAACRAINERPYSQFQSIASGPLILQSGRQQRLYFLFIYNDSTNIYAEPGTSASVTIEVQQRYRAMRGAS